MISDSFEYNRHDKILNKTKKIYSDRFFSFLVAFSFLLGDRL